MTNGIVVSVSVLFVPTDSMEGDYVFTYSIRIQGRAEGLPFEKARLSTREWRINNGRGESSLCVLCDMF